ncbi:MAG: cation diffusion facilitator family transporter [Solirubrobacteraceae bacterium]
MTTDAVADAATKRRAAAVSVASNMTQIAFKLAAGIATGSVSILTEAAHSTTDLIASLVAFVSVRKADEPADADHLYGHAKVENVAAAIEGVLILFGAVLITYESVRKLIEGSHVRRLGLGIAVIGISAVANAAVSVYVGRRARETDSPALEGDAAHLSSDAGTSVAVLLGLVAVQATGETWIDPVVALCVAVAIVVAGVRILRRSSRALVDEALPEEELETIRSAVIEFGGEHAVVGYHRLRARRAGSQRHVDLHVQFAAGTTLEEAHRTAHQLQAAISARLGGADILIHLEPEDRVQPGTEIPAADGAKAD